MGRALAQFELADYLNNPHFDAKAFRTRIVEAYKTYRESSAFLDHLQVQYLHGSRRDLHQAEVQSLADTADKAMLVVHMLNDLRRMPKARFPSTFYENMVSLAFELQICKNAATRTLEEQAERSKTYEQNPIFAPYFQARIPQQPIRSTVLALNVLRSLGHETAQQVEMYGQMKKRAAWDKRAFTAEERTLLQQTLVQLYATLGAAQTEGRWGPIGTPNQIASLVKTIARIEQDDSSLPLAEPREIISLRYLVLQHRNLGHKLAPTQFAAPLADSEPIKQ